MNRGPTVGVMVLGLVAASVFYPTASGLDTLWSGLPTVWALALVGAYVLSTRRALSETTTAAPEEPTATGGRGYRRGQSGGFQQSLYYESYPLHDGANGGN